MDNKNLVKSGLPVPVKRGGKDRDELWLQLMLKVRKGLLDPNKTPERTRELLEIRAKLQIMGPEFLEKDITRVQAMFDKTSL